MGGARLYARRGRRGRASASLLTALAAAACLGCLAQTAPAITVDREGRVLTERSGLALRLTPRGQLDRTFDGNGYRRLKFPGFFSVVDVHRLIDGRVLASGRGWGGRPRLQEIEAGVPVGPAFVRGRPRDSSVGSLQLLPDGKIVIGAAQTRDCGRYYGSTGDSHFVRLNTDLTPDPTFGGGDGSVVVDGDCVEGPRRYLSDFVVEPGGGVIAAASGVLYRLGPDGGLDPAFGGGDGTVDLAAQSLARGQPHGGIFAANASTSGIDVWRLHPDGTTDGTFGGGDGVATIPYDMPGTSYAPRALVAQVDGKTLAVGGSGQCEPGYLGDLRDFKPCETTITLAQLDSAGELDGSFGGGDGVVRVTSDGFFSELRLTPLATRLLIDALAVPRPGGAAFDSSTVFVFDRSGNLDGSFGEGGVFLPQRFPARCGNRLASAFAEAQIGTPESDLLRSDSPIASFHHGLGGDDVFDLYGDDQDVICGGRGDDRITTGGNEAVEPDRAYGQWGADILRLGGGRDDLFGGPGPDRLVGGDGIDHFWAGRGADTLRARDAERERVRCGPGLDIAFVDRKDRTYSCERVHHR